MNRTIQPAPIRKTLELNASPAKAFAVFTDGFDRWWPRTHTIGQAALQRAVLEPGVGGRWYGVDANGREDDWGEVLAWEPPARLLLAWRINARFAADATVHTEVEVRFTELTDGRTRVEFEHRALDRLGEGALETRDRMDGGWGRILEGFKATAEAA